MKYGNTHSHCYNCAVIGPQNQHKNKRNLSLERVQGVNNLKSHISETIWSTEIKFCMALWLNWIKVFMSKISSKSMIWTENICFLGDLVWNDPARVPKHRIAVFSVILILWSENNLKNLALLDFFQPNDSSQTTVIGYDTRHDLRLSHQFLVLKTGLRYLRLDEASSTVPNYLSIVLIVGLVSTSNIVAYSLQGCHFSLRTTEDDRGLTSGWLNKKVWCCYLTSRWLNKTGRCHF